MKTAGLLPPLIRPAYSVQYANSLPLETSFSPLRVAARKACKAATPEGRLATESRDFKQDLRHF